MHSSLSPLILLSLFSLALAGCNRSRWCQYGRGHKVASWRCLRDRTLLLDIDGHGRIQRVTRCNDCFFLVELHKVRFGSNYYRVKMFHNNRRLSDITSGNFVAKCVLSRWPLGVGGAGSHDFHVKVGGKVKKVPQLSVGVQTTITTRQKRFSITWADGEVSNCGAHRCTCSGPERCYV